MTFLFLLSLLAPSQVIFKEKDINNQILVSIGIGTSLFDKDWPKFVEYEKELIQLRDSLIKIDAGGKLNKMSRQIADKMLKDIAVLKPLLKDNKLLPEIGNIHKSISQEDFKERLATLVDLDSQKKEIKDYEKGLNEIRKLFGAGSFADLTSTLNFLEIGKNAYLVLPSLAPSADFINRQADYFYNNGWKGNFLVEVRILRLICHPGGNLSQWEKDYLGNIKNLEGQLNLVMDMESQESLELSYYKMFHLFFQKNYAEVCKLFEKIPKAWLIGSQEKNWFYIIHIYWLASESYHRIPNKGPQAIETQECAIHYILSSIKTSSNRGAKIFVFMATNLHDKYQFYKKEKDLLRLDALFDEVGINPPWRKGLKLDQN